MKNPEESGKLVAPRYLPGSFLSVPSASLAASFCASSIAFLSRLGPDTLTSSMMTGAFLTEQVSIATMIFPAAKAFQAEDPYGLPILGPLMDPSPSLRSMRTADTFTPVPVVCEPYCSMDFFTIASRWEIRKTSAAAPRNGYSVAISMLSKFLR